jgi:hypothetical protein
MIPPILELSSYEYGMGPMRAGDLWRHDRSASPVDWDHTRNGRSPDERSLRRCNSLKFDGAMEVQRHVRKKSLYLRDSSDMNHTPNSLRQSAVHVLNEWADTTAMGVFTVRTGPA